MFYVAMVCLFVLSLTATAFGQGKGGGGGRGSGGGAGNAGGPPAGAAADGDQAAAQVTPAAHQRELGLIEASATPRDDPVDVRMTGSEMLQIARMDALMLV